MASENLRFVQSRYVIHVLKNFSSAAKRGGDPSGQSWSTFLHNRAPHVAAMDLFVVPTIGFIQLYVLVIVQLVRRELVSINVTNHRPRNGLPHQISEAFPWDEVPHYLIRDRDPNLETAS